MFIISVHAKNARVSAGVGSICNENRFIRTSGSSTELMRTLSSAIYFIKSYNTYKIVDIRTFIRNTSMLREREKEKERESY